ncbi:hypothetical protein C1646_776639 [Rhizophagus diaphanus]|nr:hypothetical protein C1646_776639 [Rhizophagus diaphanus] [Rhizophagus sp. MUCL 43196]
MYPYAHFIDYRDLEDFVKKVVDKVEKPYSVFIDFDLYKSRFNLHLFGLAKEDRPEKKEFQPIENETTLSKEANQVTVKYEWLEIGDIRKGFINFQAQSLEASFGKVTEVSAKPKRGIVERIGDAISNSCLFVGLSEIMINIEKLRDALKHILIS